jgi:nucleotide-binding universal stress UspA family protein
MPGPVVCCVDGSDQALAAARVAKGLAERLGLELVFLHVAPSVEQPGVSSIPLGHQRLAEVELEDAEVLVQQVAGDVGAVDARRRIELGRVAETLISVCEDEGAEFIVLGSHGRGGLKSALLGSVSGAVAAKAPCVVVIVPPGAAVPAALS